MGITKTASFVHKDNQPDNTSMKPLEEKKFGLLSKAISKVKNSNGAPLQIKIPLYVPAGNNSQNHSNTPSIAIGQDQPKF